MENTETSTDILVEETEELSLRDEAVKTLVLTAAATAGMWGTLLVGGYAYGKIKARREAKAVDQKFNEIVNDNE